MTGSFGSVIVHTTSWVLPPVQSWEPAGEAIDTTGRTDSTMRIGPFIGVKPWTPHP